MNYDKNAQNKGAASVFALVFAASMAAAQAPVRVRGVIDNVDGKSLSVKARDGAR